MTPEERLADYIWGDGSPDFDILLRELKEALRDAGLALIEVGASADTHAERCDVKQAQPARVGSAVPEGQTPKPSQGAEQQQCRSGR